jgi:tripeptide aminopeptidase
MKKIQDLFIKLVKIDSPFGQEKELADFVIKELKKLNLIVKKDKFGNIIARSKKFNKKDSILICAHLDTIESNKGIKPKIKKGVIYSDEKHILGADNKAAIAEIIHALQKTKTFSNVELLFSVQEENGLAGVKSLNKKLIKSKKALVLDHSFPPGYIVLRTPCAEVIRAKIKSKSVHAARADINKNLINLSGQCIGLLNFKDPEVKYNMGFINGGTRVNTSPEFVEIGMGIRSFSEGKLKRSIQRNKKILINKGFSVARTRIGYGYSYNKNDKFVKELIERFRELKIKTRLEDSMGLSDANILNKHGIKAIEIGYGPRNTHTNKEFVTISDMEKMSNFLSTFFKEA